MVQGYLQTASEKEAARLHYGLRKPEILRKGLWLAFLLYCVISMFCFGGATYQPLCVLFALLYGSFLSIPGYFSLANDLRNYWQSNGSLDGFSLERAYSTDIESSFTVDGDAKQVFNSISQALAQSARAKFRRHDVRLGEMEAVGTGSSPDFFLSDPSNIYVRVTAAANGKVNAQLRIVASALTHNPQCYVIENIVRSAANHPASAVTEEIKVQRFLPLWAGRVMKSVTVFAMAALIGTFFHNCYQTTSSTMSQMLDANEYRTAYDVIAKEDIESATMASSGMPTDRFVALLGQNRYAEAIEELDRRTDQEYIAYALAEQGKMKDAQKALDAMEPDLHDTDIGALYLAKAMVANSAGNRNEALNDLAVARASTSDLHNLASQTEIRLMNELGKHSEARQIEKAMALTVADAKGSLAYQPWQFPLYAGGLFAAYSVASLRAHRRWHRKPAGLPSVEKEIELAESVDGTDAFDKCLVALSKAACTITNMDDESGLLEAADAQGNHLVIKLSPAESGCKMFVKSDSSKASASIERLRLVLSEPVC